MRRIVKNLQMCTGSSLHISAMLGKHFPSCVRLVFSALQAASDFVETASQSCRDTVDLWLDMGFQVCQEEAG